LPECQVPRSDGSNRHIVMAGRYSGRVALDLPGF
jgi:hypothetical protein